jgi:hypothetical protein
LYDDPESAGLNVLDLAGYLAARLPDVEVSPRSDYFTHHLARFAEEQQDMLVQELEKQLSSFEIEDAILPEDRGKAPAEPTEDLDLGAIYDATGLQAALKLLLPPEESGADHLHIVFTDHCIADWDLAARRMRIRIAALGQPTVISTSGLIEAPEKPKQYHFMRAQLAFLGQEEALDEVEGHFSDTTLGYADPRLNEVLKGYVLKAAFYRMFNEAACRVQSCRLFDAATHEEMLEAQTGRRPGLCHRHAEMLTKAGGEVE